MGSPTPSFAFLFLNNTFSKVGVGIHEMFGHFSVIRTELFLCGKDPRGTYSHKLFFGLTADGSEGSEQHFPSGREVPLPRYGEREAGDYTY